MIKEKIKNNRILRQIVKSIKIYKAYYEDAKEYSKYYLEKAEISGKSEYRIMLLIHSLEKGMCMPDMRPFGHNKAKELLTVLQKALNKNSFEYNLGISALSAWISIFNEKGWAKNKICKQVEDYLNDKINKYDAGYKFLNNPIEEIQDGKFEEIFLSRHSVRDFESREIEWKDLRFALECFCAAPTACNRQMCRVYQIGNEQLKDLLNDTILGVGGFNIETMTYFIITYDIAAFDFFGERNQGYMNAGLVAMNFVNGLHCKGIGSCFMQWANKKNEDIKVRKALGLLDSEKIAIVIGAGYYRKQSTIPCSCRRDILDVYRLIDK